MTPSSGGQVPRKPLYWEDLSTVTKTNGLEGVAAATYGADGTGVNVNADGGLKVHITGTDVAGGSAVSVADGSDVAEGATTDAAVTSNTTGTISGKLRGLVAWAYTRMPAALGSTTASASLPVVVASDQAAVASKTADGADVALGTTTDAASSTTGTVIAHLRKIRDLLNAALAVTQSGTWNVGLSKTGTGYAPYFMDAISTTVTTVSGAAGKFGGLAGVINVNTGPAYLQCFDTAGAVTLGSTAPTFVIAIPANSTAANGVAIVADLGGVGLNLANGLKIAATTTAKGSSALGTGLSGTLYYA